jgi:LacI family transcriptional regulator
VVIGRLVGGLEDRCLRPDNVAGARAATRHLIDLGHRRIAHITGRITHQDAVDRLEGYRLALREAGIARAPELVVEGDFEESSGFQATEQLFQRGVEFTAIFAAADLMAYGARLSLFRHDLAVPEDVSLVGFDDQHLSPFAIPPLTTVRQPRLEMGQGAAAALLAALKGEPPKLPALRVEFVPRASSAACRG